MTTDEIRALAERVAKPAEPLGFEYHDPTYDVRQEAATALRDLSDRLAKATEALREIDAYHIPDCPTHFAGDELSWAQRQHGHIRSIARATLAEIEASHDAG